MSVAMGRRFGVDEDDNKTFRDTAIWLGYNFTCKTRAAAVRVGQWGIQGLCTIELFRPDDTDILVIADHDRAQAEMDGFLRSAAAHHPLLSPQETSPPLWNGFRSGGLPSDHWHKPTLVRTGHKKIENTIRHHIATGAMQPVLDAVSALQSIAYVINRPMLDLVRRMGPPGPEPTQVQNWQFDIAVAESASVGERFVPLCMDTRGRLIPIPWLSFIREDRVRALFLFANGEPITADGVLWLPVAEKRQWL